MSGTVVWAYFATCIPIRPILSTPIPNFSAKYISRAWQYGFILISSLIAFVIQFVFFLGLWDILPWEGRAAPELVDPYDAGINLDYGRLGLGFGIIISRLPPSIVTCDSWSLLA